MPGTFYLLLLQQRNKTFGLEVTTSPPMAASQLRCDRGTFESPQPSFSVHGD